MGLGGRHNLFQPSPYIRDNSVIVYKLHRYNAQRQPQNSLIWQNFLVWTILQLWRNVNPQSSWFTNVLYNEVNMAACCIVSLIFVRIVLNLKTAIVISLIQNTYVLQLAYEKLNEKYNFSYQAVYVSIGNTWYLCTVWQHVWSVQYAVLIWNS